jgi:hypothetical protein
MIKDTGGTAFPSDPKRIGTHCDTRQGVYEAQDGMTLRDYFAAKAMQGLVAADTQFTMGYVGIAELAFNQAEAMLKARKM